MSERSHKSPKVRIGKPPLRMRPTPQTSRTSPRQIARRKRMKEALGFRERGCSFEQIAREMRISISTAHGYVVEGMNAIPLESAKVVLGIELKRLDALFAGHYEKACKGDVGATYAALQVIDRRARLLGLYPQHGSMAQILVAAGNGEVMPVTQIEFVTPTGAKIDMAGSPEPSAPGQPPFGQPPFAWQKALPAPDPDRQMFQDVHGRWRWGRTE